MLRFEGSATLPFPENASLSLPPISLPSLDTFPPPSFVHCPLLHVDSSLPLAKQAHQVVTRSLVLDSLHLFTPFLSDKGGMVGSRSTQIAQTAGLSLLAQIVDDQAAAQPLGVESWEEYILKAVADVCFDLICFQPPVWLAQDQLSFERSPASYATAFSAFLVDLCKEKPDTFPSILAETFLTLFNDFFTSSTPPLGSFSTLQALASFFAFYLTNTDFAWPLEHWGLFVQQLEEEEEERKARDATHSFLEGVMGIFLQLVLGSVLEEEGPKRLLFSSIPNEILQVSLHPGWIEKRAALEEVDELQFFDPPPQGVLKELCELLMEKDTEDEDIASLLMENAQSAPAMALLLTKAFLFEAKDKPMLRTLIGRFGEMFGELLEEDASNEDGGDEEDTKEEGSSSQLSPRSAAETVLSEIMHGPYEHNQTNTFKSMFLCMFVEAGIFPASFIVPNLVGIMLENQTATTTTTKWADVSFLVTALHDLFVQSLMSTKENMIALEGLENGRRLPKHIEDMIERKVEEGRGADEQEDAQLQSKAIQELADYYQQLSQHLVHERESVKEGVVKVTKQLETQFPGEEDGWVEKWILEGIQASVV